MSIAINDWAPGDSDGTLDDYGVSDEELTALALAADPEQLPDPDAVPLAFYQRQPAGGLPQWYMPAIVARGSRRWKLPVVIAVIAGFLLIDGFGLCITYGQLVFA